MSHEDESTNTPAGPAHSIPPVATSTPAECLWELHRGPLKGSPWGIIIRPGATDTGRKWGLQRASTAAGSQGAACGFRIRWQRKAIPAPAQNLEGTGNPWTQFEIWIFPFFVSGAPGISWLIRGSLKPISSFRHPLCCSPHPSNQVTVTLHIHSCIQLQKSELAKTSVTGAQHLPLSQDLYLL